MFRRLRETYDGFAEKESQVLGTLAGLDLLVIDDLGHEGRGTDAVVGALHEILERRMEHRLQTIVTSNLGLAAIGGRYDESIRSRLSAFDVVCVEGRDRRLD
jgi:DNA replication protein DnaC